MVMNLKLEDGKLLVLDADGDALLNQDDAIDFLWMRCEENRIGRRILDDKILSANKELIENIRKVVFNYFEEKESFLEKNYEFLLRAALMDTEEDLGDAV